MRYRLGKNLGENSLRSYLSKHLFILSKIAEEVGISNNALYSYLDGEIRKPRREILENIASITDLHFGIDEEGVYFEEKPDADVITEDLPVDDEMQEVLDHISKIKDPRRRETILSIITMLSEMPPEKVKIIKAMIGMIE